MTVPKMLLTPTEAAQALSISRSKLYELLSKGQLASVRVGTSRRIPHDALLSFVAQLSEDKTFDPVTRR